MKDLVVRLKVDGSGVFPAFATLEKKAGQLATSGFGRLKTAIAGAFSVGAVAAYSKSTLDWAGHLTDVATRLGVSTEYIQEMEFALKQSGASMDDLVSFTEKLNRARAAALVGGPKGQQISETSKTQFGIDETMLKGPVQPIIDAIAKQFESGNVQTLTTALSRMGIKGAGAMTAAFADGLSDGRATARKMGAVVAEDIVEQLDIVGDRLTILSMLLRSQFGPALADLTKWVVESVAFIRAGTKGWGTRQWAEGILGVMVPYLSGAGKAGKLGPAAMKGLISNKTSGTSSSSSAFDYAAAGEAMAAVRKSIDDTIRERTERRKRSGLGGFDFTPVIKEPKDRSYHAPSSDSLISVGNFLGHGRSAMQTIAQETNRILGRMDEKLGRLVERKSSGDDNSLGIAEED